MVKKAVIPAAGFGTRVLPATKSVPKEMLPVVDKPAIQYIVEECINSGIEDILIITARGKESIQDHFDKSPELEKALSKPGKEEILRQVQSVGKGANIYFIRQREALGLGHAVLQARKFTGDDSFVVLYPDDVIISKKPVALQLIEAYEEYGKPCVGIKEVPRRDIGRYSSLKVEKIEGNLYKVTDMIEKPRKGQEYSLFSILGRCLLSKEIYPILEKTLPGAGGEIQLTDAMKELALKGEVNGVDYEGKRYDLGNKLGFLEANVEIASLDPDLGPKFREYLKKYVKNL